MAFEESPFEAKQPLYSYHHSDSNETPDTLNSSYHDLLKNVFVAVTVNSLSSPPGYQQLLNYYIHLDVE